MRSPARDARRGRPADDRPGRDLRAVRARLRRPAESERRTFERLRELRQAICDVLAAGDARGARGPVQVNVPLTGSLSSTEIDGGWRPPSVLPEPAIRRPAAVGCGVREARAAALAVGLRPGLRGLIVAGSPGGLAPGSIGLLAAATGYPLLADAASSLRRPAAPNLVCEADLLWSTRGSPRRRPARRPRRRRAGLAHGPPLPRGAALPDPAHRRAAGARRLPVAVVRAAVRPR